MDKIHFIKDIAGLKDQLEKPYIVLIGSALSGKSFPTVPMTEDVIRSVLNAAANKLIHGSYGDKLLSEYANSLCYGKKTAILKTTKFEEFLWQVELAAGRSSLDDLLFRLYSCQGNEFGFNQRAISWLLSTRACLACITTNFDNSIELSSPGISYYDHPDYPSNLPGVTDSPVVIKIHGDATRHTCVATSRQLSYAKKLESHQYLRALLSGYIIFVIGYSGFGDTDIYPHLAWLSENNTKFIWAVREESSVVPFYTDYKVQCNLESSDPNFNLLVGLGLSEGMTLDKSGSPHSWKRALDRWCQTQPIDVLGRIVLLTMYGQVGWPIVHVSKFISYPLFTTQPEFDRGMVFLQVSAYRSAMESFNKMLVLPKLTLLEQIQTLEYIGFTQWRMGDLNKSLDTLWNLINYFYNTNNPDELEELANGLRIYLEVARDKLIEITSIKERMRVYSERRIKDVMDLLESITQIDIRSDILTRTVIINIDHLIHEPVDSNEVKNLFNIAKYSHLWGAAEAIARLLICISFIEGIRALWDIDKKLIERHQWNQIRKSVAAFLYAITGQKFPIIFSLLDGPLFAKVAIFVRQLIFRNFIKIIESEFYKDIKIVH